MKAHSESEKPDIFVSPNFLLKKKQHGGLCVCVLVEVVRRGINLHFPRQEHRLGRRKDKSVPLYNFKTSF